MCTDKIEGMRVWNNTGNGVVIVPNDPVSPGGRFTVSFPTYLCSDYSQSVCPHNGHRITLIETKVVCEECI
jgi:hypothetical protein